MWFGYPALRNELHYRAEKVEKPMERTPKNNSADRNLSAEFLLNTAKDLLGRIIVVRRY